MKERPILFKAEMVRAILDGRKTQTRRAVKPQPASGVRQSPFSSSGLEDGHGRELSCPYGKPGDQLWVREATIKVEDHGYEGPVYVESDEGRACLEGGLAPGIDDCVEVEPYELRIRPSIHMPRASSRITLEITGVRVERLQDISEGDSIAEGCTNSLHLPGGRFANENFAHLWWVINGDGAWETNPWVWVIEFKRIKP